MAKKRIKRGNGSGSVVFLGENRRNPYAARAPVTEFDDRGYPKYKVIGYYKTRTQAEQALYNYMADPYDLDGSKLTFAEMFEMYLSRREKEPGGISKSNKGCIMAAYKQSAPLHDRKFIDITTLELQTLLDDLSEEYSSVALSKVKGLWLQMWRMAEEYELIRRDRAQYVKINKADDVVHNVAFTLDEVRRIKEHAERGDLGAMSILVMILSGYRVGAYKDIKIDMDALTFCGGVKTVASKNRVVPMHRDIVDYVPKLMEHGVLFGEAGPKIRESFIPTLKRIGIDPGQKPTEHTPHDCRGTCATLLALYHVEESHIKRILGHSLKDNITQDVYIHTGVEELRESINKIMI